jgi:ketosteroid isomerase-like protein
MTTNEIVQCYFDRLAKRANWPDMLADDVVFTSYTNPPKRLAGRSAYLEGTDRFYAMIDRVEVRQLVIDGDHVVALTRYELTPPNGGAAFDSDVAEVFTVRDQRIASLAIYFDSAAFRRG